MAPTVAPYGSWRSPITTDLIISETIRLGNISLDGEEIYWLEMRPAEQGRYVLVRSRPGSEPEEVLPGDTNVRTRVHEYGGAPYAVHGGTVVYCNFTDQKMYVQRPGESPVVLTPDGQRYADMVFDSERGRVICVREDHTDADVEAVNTLVAVDLASAGAGVILASGYDFYSSPTISPDGKQLAWLSWNHPDMPWTNTELWVADIAPDGSLSGAQHVTGGVDESIFQPSWSPDGVLTFVSDRTNWWNLYRWDGDSTSAVLPMEAEFGRPQWSFGNPTYGYISENEIVCSYTQDGNWHLGTIDVDARTLATYDLPHTDFNYVEVTPSTVIFLAGSPMEAGSIVSMDLATMELETLRWSSTVEVDPGYLSMPESIAFPSRHGEFAYAIYYAPRNQDFEGPVGEKPPLLVMSHGGPTGATSSSFSLSIQFWTSRGIAVVDVNYGGSTGYGREYRMRLDGTWGIVDIDDCVDAALSLGARGLADVDGLLIRGGSAGGYTTLAALTFEDVFRAGASYYGVSDLGALATETHKFESRYLDNLIGPYPERQDLYEERSPLFHTDGLSCPVIFFQGLEDKIVLPNQAELMVDALRAKGVPVAYVPFEGEQHGFRQAKNIKRSLDGELYFYSKVLGFELAEPVEPVEIENLTRLNG
jgi:dipeptidyl aminopeptidase/acylaminoacyl peptidase